MLILVSLLSISVARAQIGEIKESFSHLIQHPKVIEDSTARLKIIKKELFSLNKNGYWLASIDSVKIVRNRTVFYFYKGQQFNDLEIEVTNNLNLSDQRLLSGLVKIATPMDLQKEIEKTITALQTIGYPFASIKSDSVRIEKAKLTACLFIDKGLGISFDSLEVSSDGISKRFLSNYLKIHFGSPYDQRIVDEVESNLSQLEFIKFNGLNTSFGLGKAQVTLDLEQKKVNQFDGIIGAVSGEEGIELTGAITLKVRNLFHSAKSIDIHWEKLRPQSQEFHMKYVHPLLLGSPLDLAVSFDQTKQDSLFSNRELSLGLDYDFSSSIQVGMAYENKLGNNLGQSQEEFGDFEIDATNFSLELFFLDRRLNPSKGWRADLDFNLGAKKSFLDQETSAQYSFIAETEFMKPVIKNIVGATAFAFGKLFNDQLYLNDLYRLGGLNTIRGFDEKELFASSYALFNLELRYMMFDQSMLFVFYDHAFLSTETFVSRSNSQGVGIGVGMQIATDNGILKLIYAMGKRNEEKFSFDQSKIHFGYVALF